MQVAHQHLLHGDIFVEIRADRIRNVARDFIAEDQRRAVVRNPNATHILVEYLLGLLVERRARLLIDGRTGFHQQSG